MPALLVLLLACRPGPADVALEPKPTTSADDLRVEPPPPLGEHRLYRWSVDGVVQPDLTERVVPAARTRRGERWVVEVTRVVGTRRSARRRRATRIGNGAPALEATLVLTQDGLLAVPFATDPDGDAVTVSASWSLDGVVRSQVMSVGWPQLAEGQVWTVTLSATDGELASAPWEQTYTVGALPPRVDAAVVEPQPLTALDDATLALLPSGDPEAFEVLWFVDGAHAHTGATLPAGSHHRDEVVHATVTPLDPLGGQPVATPAVIVANSPPSATGARIVPDPLSEALAATCRLDGFVDADGDGQSARVLWYVDEALAHEGPSLHPLHFARGDEVRCRAFPDDGEAEGAPVWSQTVEVANTPPTLATLALEPAQPVTGDLVTAVPLGAFDLDGDPVDVVIDWYVDGAWVGTGPTCPVPLVRDQQLDLVAVPDDGTDLGVEVYSLPTVVANSGPVVAEARYVPAAPRAGEPLALDLELVDPEGDPILDVVIGWRIDGVERYSASIGPGELVEGQVVEGLVQGDDGIDLGPRHVLPEVVVGP